MVICRTCQLEAHWTVGEDWYCARHAAEHALRLRGLVPGAQRCPTPHWSDDELECDEQ